MLAFSVLTPYYDETVIFSKEQLWTENEDGVFTLFYLQKIYPGLSALSFACACDFKVGRPRF